MRKRSISAKGRKKPTVSQTRKRPSAKTPIEEITLMDEISRNDLFPTPFETPGAKLTKVREMTVCGICEGFFDKIDVAIVRVTSAIREGDRIIFEKSDGLFEQSVKSMQIDRKDVKLAKTGSDIGLKVAFKPTVGTQVYKVIN